MNVFLTLKHWQLFALFVGVPIVFQAVAVGTAISSGDPTMIFYFFPVLMLVYMTTFFGWFYSLGANLSKKLPPSAPMNLSRFKLFLIIPIVYILLFSLFIAGMISNISTATEPNPSVFFLIMPLHLFCMFCMFYCMYFNAKALKAVELQRQVTFSDFVGEFFLLWFLPIGVWIIQPRINKIFDPEANNTPYSEVLDSNIR